jgi:uncharacterized protein (TIGR02646 family)
MRSITKSKDPALLRKWKKENKTTPQNLTYANIPKEVLAETKLSLLKEQKYLCAYSLQRLKGIEACHLEHVESQSKTPDKDIEYTNMAACFPSNGGDTSYGYGAPIKGGMAISLNIDFVSPHSKGCEKRFIFHSNGIVNAVAGDSCVKKTIDCLKLNHPSLVELRQRALAAHGLTISQRGLRVKTPRLTAAEAKLLAKTILNTSNKDAQLEPFCTAISQVAVTYSTMETARSRRIRKTRK